MTNSMPNLHSQTPRGPDRKSLANAIRALSMDAVQRASSGHPGMPMGMADIAEVLWNDFMRHNPSDPQWWDRDRFMLSNGHGSMLHYSLLHLSGYDLGIEDLKAFRQLHSRTAGHPEYGETPGVETTTGPLGQGLANAVGMALAEKLLAARFNRDDITLFGHYTYVFLGDGCLMEGISHEVCSLAGTLGLGKLICMYDDNNISIDGEVEGWFTDNTPERFRAYGWHVIDAVDGHDPEQIKQAIEQARDVSDRPSLLCCQTIIGYGAPNKQGTEATHGAPLGDDEIAAARKQLDWPHAPFEVPAAIYQGWDAKASGQQLQEQWQQRWVDYQQRYPDAAEELQRRMHGSLPQNWQQHCLDALQQAQTDMAKVATRKASQMALETLAPLLPELVGGSADLAGSNNTIWSGSVDVNTDAANGNYVYYGVREFGMTAIGNGLALHGGVLPYVATFLVFSDYARNAVRMSALLPAQVIHVYTHDSIGLGEDGPTHQPVEHVASLRLIPGLSVWRPCDTVETLQAWIAAIENQKQPTALILTRQGLPPQQRDTDQLANIARGAYVLHEPDSDPQALIIATGSEVQLAMTAAEQLAADGVAVRVVSMPNVQVFSAQDADYREQVLPASITARVAVEAGVSDIWYRWVGSHGRVVGVDRFGASAPGDELFREYDLTGEKVAAAVRECLSD